MSLSYDRQAKIVASFKDSIRNIIKNGRRFQWECTFIRKAIVDLWASDNWKRLPRYEQAYLRGYADSLMDAVWREDVEFSYVVNNKRLLIHSDEYREKVNYKKLDTNTGAFVWKENPDKFFTLPGSHEQMP